MEDLEYVKSKWPESRKPPAKVSPLLVGLCASLASVCTEANGPVLKPRPVGPFANSRPIEKRVKGRVVKGWRCADTGAENWP